MKSNLILCVIFSALFCLFARPATAVPPAAAPPKMDWKAGLRAAITDDGSLPPLAAGGVIQITVPAKAGQILESQPKADLLLFLAKLRAEPPSWKAGIVDTWIFVVRNGLHGTPMTITNSIVVPGGKSVLQKTIPVYCYTCRYAATRTNATPGHAAVSKKK